MNQRICSSYVRTNPALGKAQATKFYIVTYFSTLQLISQVEMKFQLLFVFSFYLLHCSLGNVTEEPDEFCDEGPPGKYCLPDLSGWHDCHVDPSTGKMVDKVHTCPANTR